ncbi:hypothetical protein V4C55_43995, partial [Paraburkholderia sabiae]
MTLIARCNDVNANLLFKWRRLYLAGENGLPRPLRGKRRVGAVENSLDKRRRTRQAYRAAASRDQSEAGVDRGRCFAT